MPDWVAVVLLGILEGLTEFIPVSSTGHLLLAGHWLAPQTDLFYVVIQSGAVVAVLPLFADRCRRLLQAHRDPDSRDYLLKLACAFVITGAGGLLLEKGGFKLPDRPAPIALALIGGGVLFIAIERWLRGRTQGNEVTWAIAIAVGIGQLIAAVFPGMSRSGSTILIALLMGLGRPAATEFSFLVGIPTLLAAGGLKIAKSFGAGAPSEDWGMVILGTAVSAVVSFAAVKWFLRFVQTHTFEGFGWYRIALGAAILLLMR